jgi:non-ribosomal peptide synthetase component E (peptide arylation enzyme)
MTRAEQVRRFRRALAQVIHDVGQALIEYADRIDVDDPDAAICENCGRPIASGQEHRVVGGSYGGVDEVIGWIHRRGCPK